MFLTHLEIVFVQGNEYRYNFTLCHVDNQFSWHRLLEMLSFLPFMFLASLSNTKRLKLCIYIYLWIFNSVPFVYMSLLVLVPYYFYNYGSVVYFRSFQHYSFCSGLF